MPRPATILRRVLSKVGPPDDSSSGDNSSGDSSSGKETVITSDGKVLSGENIPPEAPTNNALRTDATTYVPDSTQNLLLETDITDTLSVAATDPGVVTEHTWYVPDLNWGAPNGGDGPEIDEIEISYQTADFNGQTDADPTVELVRGMSDGPEKTTVGLNSGDYTGTTATLDLSGYTTTTVAGPLEVTLPNMVNPTEPEVATLTARGDGNTYTAYGMYPNPTTVRTLPQSEVQFVDVGQADSTVIRTPDDETVVIDTGNSYGDFGWYMEGANNITHIDFLIITHAHTDHIGGAQKLVERFENKFDGVGTVIDSGVPHGTVTYNDFITTVQNSSADLVTPTEGDELPISGVDMKILNPTTQPPESNTLHDESVCVRIEDSDGRVIFVTGDANRGVERRLVSEYPQSELSATVLQLGHHGAGSTADTSAQNTANAPAWLDATDPEYCLVSSPIDSQFGHPNDTTLTNLADRNITTYWTAIHGTTRSTGSDDSQPLTQKTDTTNPEDMSALKQP